MADRLYTLVRGEKTMSEEMKKEIARRFAAAFISYAHGVKMDYAYKKYVGDEPVGELWQQLASLAIEGWREMQGNIVGLTLSSANDKGKIQ